MFHWEGVTGRGHQGFPGCGNWSTSGSGPWLHECVHLGKIHRPLHPYLFAVFLYIILNEKLTLKEWDNSLNSNVEWSLRHTVKCWRGEVSETQTLIPVFCVSWRVSLCDGHPGKGSSRRCEGRSLGARGDTVAAEGDGRRRGRKGPLFYMVWNFHKHNIHKCIVKCWEVWKEIYF